ncbi:epoxide hydrolase domain-containing protein [Geopyxis carbonaria]|nr:epoxide hydrolase domain-containing protein [Geopyxis carbonaria]
MAAPTPFTIAVPDSTLDWLNTRLSSTRLPPQPLTPPPAAPWSYGVPQPDLASLLVHWRTTYSWRAVEASLNARFKQFTVPLPVGAETITLHFVHHRSSHADAIPLLFAHGWPGNFTEVEALLEPLTNPPAGVQAFHIVAPSLPGFAFSSAPKSAGFSLARIAELYHTLMLRLGYSTYTAQGGDWGSIVTRLMATNYPTACVGVHVNFLVAGLPSWRRPVALGSIIARWFSADEKKRLARMMWWQDAEAGYSKMMGTKPLTVAYALVDSPAGQLAWIVDKLHPLSPEGDDGGVATTSALLADRDTLLTWTMFYVLAASPANSAIYKEAFVSLKEELLETCIPASVAFGHSAFEGDVGYVPRWWAQGTVAHRISFWREHRGGGHFASVEDAERLVGDLREWIKGVEGGERRRAIEAGVKAGEVMEAGGVGDGEA